IAKPSYHIGPQVMKHFSIHFVLKGKVLYTYQNKKKILKQGDVFVIYPNTEHQYKTYNFESASPLEMRWLDFNGPKSMSALKEIGLSPEKPYIRKKMNEDLHIALERF